MEKIEFFHCGTRIVSGPGALAALEEWKAERLLLVADSLYVSNGIAERVGKAGAAKNIDVLDRVSPQPTAELVAVGVARLRAVQPDVIVALGDGDVLDWAKAMAYFAGTSAKVAVVPTAPSSGAEVMPFVTMRHGRQRRQVRDPRLAPDMVLLDGSLLEPLPRELLAQSGFEALRQALEGFTARRGGLITETLTAEAFSVLYAALPTAAAQSSQRQKIHTASTMGALGASQAGQGLCLAMAESLHARFPVSQGRLSGILLPAVVACNAYVAGEKYTRLSRAAGMPGGAGQLQRGLCRLRRNLKLPETLAQAGVEPKQLWAEMDGIVEDTLASAWCKDNPMTVEDFMVRRILEQVTGRGR